MSRRPDDGYAIVVAVAALAVFSAVAFAFVNLGRGDINDLRAQYVRARLEAAADAGLAQAIAGLAVDDRSQRWSIDGRARAISFEGVKLAIAIQDERGKIPLADLSDDQVQRMFSAAGAQGDQLATLVDAFQDWLDDDDDPRPHGAEAPYYAQQHIRPRNSAPLTVDELARLRGMTPAIFGRIRGALTPYFGIGGGFSPTTANPIAVAAMSEGGADGPDAISRQREADGERTAIEIADQKDLTGRGLTVVVHAENADGRLDRRTVIVLTGRTSPAYYVREQQ